MRNNPRDFLIRVLPWPSDDDQGFCNVQAMCHMPDGSKPWTGWPTRDVDQFLQHVHTYLGWRNPPDIYMCLSRQAKTKPADKQGKIHAAKSQADALALKAIWWDVDVGKQDGYATVGAAVDAVTAVCAAEGLPKPTAWVASGGGLHVYWISDRALTPAEWRPYAEGLKEIALKHTLLGKGDYGVTVDSARVLRPPGTFNLKKQPPRPVKLLGMREKDYDFATELSALLAVPHSLAVHAIGSLPARPSPLFANTPIESLAEGIVREPLPPLDPTPLGAKVGGCGWFREALITGGQDFSQGLWNLSTLAATFMENGHALAHKMARGHPGYIRDETEALWERKLAERQSRGLGWPSCKSIQAEGCTHCAACPHLVKGKSPLNLARIPSASAPATAAMVPGNVGTSTGGTPPMAHSGPLVPLTDADMPNDTYTVIDGIVNKIVMEPAPPGDAPNALYFPLFYGSKLYGPAWAQTGPDAINFYTSVDLGSFRPVNIERSQLTSMELEGVLLRAGVMPHAERHKQVKDFIMSWLAKLNDAAAARLNAPFGWVMNEDKCEGFAYGSVLYKADGTLGPVGTIDATLRSVYTPQGDVTKWHEAFKLLTDQKRPGLEVIVAAAFGAPLMFGTGEYCVLMSVFGETGANKTAAARVGLAVWAKPVMAKEAETATQKSVINRLGQIKNLPYFWDEIKDDEAQRKAYNILYMASGGAEGDRLRADITHREKGSWQTICGIFSNPSFGNYVSKENPNTTAGLMRLFEWKEVVPPKNAPGQISTNTAARAFGVLDYHFGGMGKQWSAFLGPNRDLVEQATIANAHFFEQAVLDPSRNSNDERYWIAFAAAVQTGAELANTHLGLNFDTDAMRTFLIDKIKMQRARSWEENIQGGSLEHTEQMLTGFLKAMTRNTLKTATSAMKKAGHVTPIEVLDHPMPGNAVQVHWILDRPELRFSRAEFNNWLTQVKGDPRVVMDGLKKYFGAVIARGTLGAGTNIRTLAEPIVTLQVTAGGMLDQYLKNPPPVSADA